MSSDFAHLRTEAEKLIRAHAPARLQEPLISLLRPAIALEATRADDSQIPRAASKFGGAPDVPQDFQWPRWNDKPLGFLAQINLQEVAPFDLKNKLPKSGLLSFFYFIADEDYWPMGMESEKGAWHVSYFAEEALIRAELPTDSIGSSGLTCAAIQ